MSLILGLIPDGARRYAKKSNISFEESYNKSIDKIFEIADWCRRLEIKHLIVWGFSTENWKRSIKERRILFELYKRRAMKFLKENRRTYPKIEFKGQLYRFKNNGLFDLFKKIEEKTNNNG